jgi:hypothetical protein
MIPVVAQEVVSTLRRTEEKYRSASGNEYPTNTKALADLICSSIRFQIVAIASLWLSMPIFDVEGTVWRPMNFRWVGATITGVVTESLRWIAFCLTCIPETGQFAE